MSALPRADVAVVGSGIVGLSCAFHLMQRGASCLLIDPGGPAAGSSRGNAGSISVGNVMPQSTPGIALKGARMLLDRNAPLKLDLPRLPQYWRWLASFVAAGSGQRLEAIMDALHAINHAARAPWLQLAQAIGAGELVRPSGYLHVYSSEEAFAAAAIERAAMRARGVEFEVLGRDGLLDLEPGLGSGFVHGTFQRAALALTDPGGFCERLHAALLARGAQALAASVHSLHPLAGGCRLETSAGSVHAGRVVVAAGAWTAPLLRPLGVRLPLVAARGYHLMYRRQPGVLQRPTLWAERYMVLSPMAAGIRMTSIKELTTTASTPRFSLIRRRDADARTLFPSLAGPAQGEWAGLRPCTPDSLPVIDSIGEHVHVACGHGHLGMTQGPVSGRLLAQMLAGEQTDVPLQPYRLARFD